MEVDNSGVVIGEDALSTYYSTSSNSESTSSSARLTTSATSSSSAASSSLSSEIRPESGFLNYFRRRFGFGVAVDDARKKQDAETLAQIMKSFRNNDIEGMEKFIDDGVEKIIEVENSVIETEDDEQKMWWDDYEHVARKPCLESVVNCKYTPHPKKGISKLPPRVLKAVRFDMENTPEDREKRPFTPMFTSTPKQFCSNNGSDSEDELPPLRDCDSNTVIPPSNILNNTSSILLSNTSVMLSLNKCRQQTLDAVSLQPDKNSYKICYDDTDEEEVLEEEPAGVVMPTPARSTFIISKEESEPSTKTISLQEPSIDQLNMSTNSSVVLGLDCIDSYIQHLEDEIEAANRYAREKDVKRAIGAVRQARHLQERFSQMNDNINEMCNKLPQGLEEFKDIGYQNDHHDVSAAFEDSQWEAQLGSEAGSFDNCLS